MKSENTILGINPYHISWIKIEHGRRSNRHRNAHPLYDRLLNKTNGMNMLFGYINQFFNEAEVGYWIPACVIFYGPAGTRLAEFNCKSNAAAKKLGQECQEKLDDFIKRGYNG